MGPYPRNVFSSKSRIAPQVRQTWYEYPSALIGQPFLPCQHPLDSATAAPAKAPTAMVGHHCLNRLRLSDIGCGIGSGTAFPAGTFGRIVSMAIATRPLSLFRVALSPFWVIS